MRAIPPEALFEAVDHRQYSSSAALSSLTGYGHRDCTPEDARRLAGSGTYAGRSTQSYTALNSRRGKGSCLDCGTPIDERAKRCKPCSYRHRTAS